MIVAHALTEATVDHATTGVDLITQVDGDLAVVTADAAYDTIAFYDSATGRDANVVVPPAKTARLSRRRPRSSARDRTIEKIEAVGRRQWKKTAGYHRQARGENAFFRYKSIIGAGLRARTPGAQVTETLLACNALNRMTEFGRPDGTGRAKATKRGGMDGEECVSTAEAGELSPRDPVEGRGHRQVAPVEGKTANTPRLGPVSTSRQRIAELLGMAVAIAWLPGPAGTRRRVCEAICRGAGCGREQPTRLQSSWCKSSRVNCPSRTRDATSRNG